MGAAAADAVALVERVLPTHDVELQASGDARTVVAGRDPGDGSWSCSSTALERSDSRGAITLTVRSEGSDAVVSATGGGEPVCPQRRWSREPLALGALERTAASDVSRILVVDDEPVVQSSRCEILRRSGYSPHGVPSARHALELLDRQSQLRSRRRRRRDARVTGVEFLFKPRERRPPTCRWC